MKDIERRFINVSELRTIREENEQPKLAGYAVVWNSLSQDLGGFREKIKKGAFTKSLREVDDVKILWNHNTDHVLGSTKAGTLSLEERSKGLYFENILPDTQFARDLAKSVDRKDIDGVSFGFSIVEDQWNENKETKNVVRTVKEANLFEVSPCTFPAYKTSQVSVRAYEQFKEQSEEADASPKSDINISKPMLEKIEIRLHELKNKLKGTN